MADEPERKKGKNAVEKSSADAAPEKPVNKALEWGLAILIMAVLIGFLAAMIGFMRSNTGIGM